MEAVIWAGGGLCGLLVIAWAAAAAKTELLSVTTSIEIDSDPDSVWAALVALGQYSDWNPRLFDVIGSPTLGSRVDFKFRTERYVHEIDVELEVVEPGRALVWSGPVSRPMRILFWGEHHFEIQERASGRVIFANHERFGGLLALPLWAYLKRDVRASYEASNLALKRRVEGR